jgi:hypothetical protein
LTKNIGSSKVKAVRGGSDTIRSMENPTSIELYQKMPDIPRAREVVKVEQNRQNKRIPIFIEYRDGGEAVPPSGMWCHE